MVEHCQALVGIWVFIRGPVQLAGGRLDRLDWRLQLLIRRHADHWQRRLLSRGLTFVEKVRSRGAGEHLARVALLSHFSTC